MAEGDVILSINAGSSSVKVSVYKHTSSAKEPQKIADADVSGISAPPASLKYTPGDRTPEETQLGEEVKDQASAFKYILDRLLQDEGLPELRDKEDVRYACHRIVHGGSLSHVEVINTRTYQYLEELSDLAPLHNATGLDIVHVVHEALPKATNMAYFDSSFHTSIPPHIYTYAIDQTVAKKNNLRKYGFHGISYSFITRSVAAHLQKPERDTNIIALHLGSGASACAIKGGRSLDTSMGLTPLAGLPGGSRSGDVDPSLVFHYTHDAGRLSSSSTKDLHITAAEEILNKKSGFKALAGTADFGAISKRADEGDEDCKLAFELFVDRVVGFVGNYYVKLNGKVDALVFAGGIGEKGVEFRRRVVDECDCLGFDIDKAKNQKPANEIVTDIGRDGAKHRTLICQTDEQFEMARGCVEAASKLSKTSS